MSHFITAVICNDPSDVESLLAQYNEQDDAYCTFHVEFANIQEAEAAFEEWKTDNQDTDFHYKDVYQWLEDWHGYTECDGAYGSYWNDDAKWDWYDDDGGRWRGAFDEYLKPGYDEESYHHRVKDYNFGRSEKAAQKAAELWDGYVLGQNPEKFKNIFWKKEYYTERYGTKENYIEASSYPSRPYAFVTPDGEWHEVGSMGWWGMDSATQEGMKNYRDEWMATINDPDLQDCYVVWVDCHI